MKAYYEALVLNKSHFPSTRILATKLRPPSRRRPRRPPPVFYKAVALIALALFLYQEVYIYKSLRNYWPVLPRLDKKNENWETSRFLLVADPQLIGYQNEPHFIGIISRWDSDRYLTKCFREVVEHVKPDCLIFLGDLMDEGSTATQTEFQASLTRFKTIYSSNHAPRIYISGDNDVGGEGPERVSPLRVKRFDEEFVSDAGPSGYFISVGSVFDGSISNISTPDDSGFKLLLSHHPILLANSAHAGSILSEVRPNLVVSAHDHVARVVQSRWPLEQRGIRITGLGRTSGSYSSEISTGPKASLTELQVPTCSYRMGVKDMGFGVLEIRRNPAGPYQIDFTILWLPDRYHQLFSYLVFSAVCGVLFLLVTCI